MVSVWRAKPANYDKQLIWQVVVKCFVFGWRCLCIQTRCSSCGFEENLQSFFDSFDLRFKSSINFVLLFVVNICLKLIVLVQCYFWNAGSNFKSGLVFRLCVEWAKSFGAWILIECFKTNYVDAVKIKHLLSNSFYNTIRFLYHQMALWSAPTALFNPKVRTYVTAPDWFIFADRRAQFERARKCCAFRLTDVH